MMGLLTATTHEPAMNGHQRFANFDPEFCRKLTRVAAASCAVLVLCAVVVLATIDSSATRCPGWLMFTNDGAPASMWILVAIAAPAAAWMCFCAVNWEWTSRQVIDRLSRAEQAMESDPKAGLFSAGQQGQALGILLMDLNALLVVVFVGWTGFCAIPLLVIAAKCA
jgi:hypothetical protein